MHSLFLCEKGTMKPLCGIPPIKEEINVQQSMKTWHQNSDFKDDIQARPSQKIYCNMAENIVLFSLCLNKLSHGKLHFRNLNRFRMCGFHANHTSSSFVSYSFIYSYHQHIRTKHHNASSMSRWRECQEDQNRFCLH